MICISLKIGMVHKINSICNSILVNLKDDAYNLTKLDKKKIRMDVKNNLNWLKDKELADLPVDELKQRKKRLSKTYAPLIAQVNKMKDKFKDAASAASAANAAEVHGDDDDDDENLQTYDKIQIPNDPSEYEKEEVKALKKTISDLGKNILSVVNNPVSKFSEEDIVTMTDYIDSVQIWLYTTSASTTIEFVAKINEINKTTEDIMKKYEEKKIFEKNENFTVRDELQLTCLTLNSSIKTNYFSLKKTDVDHLSKLINETLIWLVAHQTEHNNIYQEKLDEISDICNKIYHSMHKMKILENINLANDEESDEESDNESEDDINNTQLNIPEGNHITEDIDSLLDKLPDKLVRKNIKHDSKNDILLKVDMNKLASGVTLKYKNVNHTSR